MAAKKILFLEDNPLNRELVLATLTGPYEILCAGTVSEARSLLAENTFDLLVFDINVPGGGGDALLKELRDAGPCPPAIAVTAKAMIGDRDRLLAGGFAEYVSKPFNTRELRALVAKVLGVRSGTSSGT